MRLDRVYIDGFKNLKDFEIDFDETRLTSVVIGQNGSGKSNLIEAIVQIFRYIDLNKHAPKFIFEIEYRINKRQLVIGNKSGKTNIFLDGDQITRIYFDLEKDNFFPDLIFGYYSGDNQKLEKLFDSHQRQYYEVISREQEAGDLEYDHALNERRLFYCRQTHGVMALLSFFAYPDEVVGKLLKERLGITGFHSALALLKQPYWFSNQKADQERVKGSLTKLEATPSLMGLLTDILGIIPGFTTISTLNEMYSELKADKVKKIAPYSIWGAAGPSGSSGRALLENSFHPISTNSSIKESYRGETTSEAQLACFIKNLSALEKLAKDFRSDQMMFSALEALDISDLIRDLTVWVTRVNDETGDVAFSDLSDGERQLLMVLGLIRASRGKKALFLLDEPDTHLNPSWQHSYINLIQEWIGAAADVDDCQVILTSHNPLTIAALESRDVRVLHSDDDGKVTASPPYTNPKGMGFTATLTEIFGLPTTLDVKTQSKLDERNKLSQILERSEAQELRLAEITEKLDQLGFMFEDREPLYNDFLQAWKDVQYAGRPVLTPDKIRKRQAAMSELIKELISKRRDDVDLH